MLSSAGGFILLSPLAIAPQCARYLFGQYCLIGSVQFAGYWYAFSPDLLLCTLA